MTQTTDNLLEAQSQSMLEMLFRRPAGCVHPQLEGVDYRRCAEIAAHLVATGRAETSPAPYGGELYKPSAAERERKTAAENGARTAVLAAIAAKPDIHVDELAAALPDLPEAMVRFGLAFALGAQLAVETDGRLITAELAAERDADRAAEAAIMRADGPIDLPWLKSTGQYREQSIDRAVEKLAAVGDLATLADGCIEYSTAEQRQVRALVARASEPGLLRRARGVAVADVAAELSISDGAASMTLHALMARGWIRAERRGAEVYYLSSAS